VVWLRGSFRSQCPSTPARPVAKPLAIESTRCCRSPSGSASKPAWIWKTLAFNMRLRVLQHHTEAEGILFHDAPAHFLRHQLVTGVGNNQTCATMFFLQGIDRDLDC